MGAGAMGFRGVTLDGSASFEDWYIVLIILPALLALVVVILLMALYKRWPNPRLSRRP